MEEDEVVKLNAMGFVWDGTRTMDIDEFILDLKEFWAKNEGRYPNKRSKDPKEKTLGNKIDTIRKKYKNEELEEEEVVKLNAINFKWNGLIRRNETSNSVIFGI